MRIVTVVGARPQFIKCAAITRALERRSDASLTEVLVHTGQHYDEKMSDIFFRELGISSPKYELGIAGGSHGEMTGRMLEAVERVLVQEMPDGVLVYGDTNSTLAGALAASKLCIPLFHVEAGLRSFNMRMPEEINRILTDRVSTRLFCPTQTAVENLAREGMADGVHLVGDVMFDVALYCAKLSSTNPAILTANSLERKKYVLATCHRAENTDDPHRLSDIVDGLASVAKTLPVIFPVHPRTVAKLAAYGLGDRLRNILLVEPVSYLEMISLELNAAAIVTDSGGVQKEAFFYRVPCITVRDETEWVETVKFGWNTIVGADARKIEEAVLARRTGVEASPYGDGDAADRIIDIIQTV